MKTFFNLTNENFFTLGIPSFYLPEKVNLLELFAGYGSQRLALNRLNIPVKRSFISEIDKTALKAYQLLHNECNNLGDVKVITGKILKEKYDGEKIDLFTYSFPCQDLSIISSKRKGMKGDRSSLVFEVLRILKELKKLSLLPRCLLMENVYNLIREFKSSFNKIVKALESLGYTNFYKVMKGTDVNIPQIRKRVFMVSVLEGKYLFSKPVKFTKYFNEFLDTKNLDDYIVKTKREKLLKVKVKNPNKKIILSAIDTRFNCLGYTKNYLELPTQNKDFFIDKNGYNIRYFTERECMRAMGLNEEEIKKLSVLKKNKKYKLAGNSIIVDCLVAIFKNMTKEKK